MLSQLRSLSMRLNVTKYVSNNAFVGQSILSRKVDSSNGSVSSQRSVIYYTHSKGKLRSVRAVVQRFYRLNWGIWIRPRAGRHKHLWRKPWYIKWWAKQHVFCSEEQCKVLDQMVDARYKTPTYFVDDPYEPYQKRHNFAFVPLGKDSIGSSYVKTLYEYKTDE